MKKRVTTLLIAALLVAILAISAGPSLAVSGVGWQPIKQALITILHVEKDATIDDDLVVGDDATIGGDASVTGALAVTGAVTASDAMTVTGALTASDSVTVTGATSVGGALAVTGAITTADNITATGSMAVTGASTLTGGAAVNGNLELTAGTQVTVTDNCTLTLTSPYQVIVSAADIGMTNVVPSGVGLFTIQNEGSYTATITETGSIFKAGGNIVLPPEGMVAAYYDGTYAWVWADKDN